MCAVAAMVTTGRHPVARGAVPVVVLLSQLAPIAALHAAAQQIRDGPSADKAPCQKIDVDVYGKV